MPLRVLVAPSGFKESLSAEEVAAAICAGVSRADPTAACSSVPLVDGGEGFASALAAATGGRLVTRTVTGPVGQPVEAHLAVLGGPGPRTAVVEMAQAGGLRLVPRDLRDPLRTTSYGVGELLAAALELGAEQVLVGCGDSGVSDGGAGMAQALGARLLDADGAELGRGGAELSRLARIDLSGVDPRWRDVPIEVACNATNVLTGERGVARVFGPQKGATPEAVEHLAGALEHYARLVAEQHGVDVTGPGSGASGGLGAGLQLVLGAHLRPRYEVVMRYVDLDGLLDDADLVLTAEGSLDDQTPHGKVPCEVARRAKERGLPVIALAGTLGRRHEVVAESGIDAWASICEGPVSLETALERGEQLLTSAAERVMRAVLVGRALALAA